MFFQTQIASYEFFEEWQSVVHITSQQQNISWKDSWDIIFAVTGGGDWCPCIARFWPILIVAPDGDGCNSTSTIVRQLWANWLCVNIYYIYRIELNSHTTYYVCIYILLYELYINIRYITHIIYDIHIYVLQGLDHFSSFPSFCPGIWACGWWSDPGTSGQSLPPRWGRSDVG